MDLYRVTKSNPPTEDDMKSHWDLGHRPPGGRGEAAQEREEATYKKVSTFTTLEAAARKARLRDLGEYVAHLEVPDDIPRSQNDATGHAGLIGTTPAQLLGYVRDVQRVDDVLD